MKKLTGLIEEGTEGSIETARELLRAAEKRHPDFDLEGGDESPSGVDWMRLQKMALQPTLSERLLRLVEHFDDATVARSGVLPAALFAGVVVFLYQLPLHSFSLTLLALGIAYVVLAVTFLWGAAAYRAYGRVTRELFPPSSVFGTRQAPMRLAMVLPAIVAIGALAVPFVLSYAKGRSREVDSAVAKGSNALDEHRYSDALLTFEQASRLLEDDPTLFMTMGKRLYEAAMNLDRDDPNQREEQIRLARAGIAYLQRAVALRPDSSEGRTRVAELQYVLGEHPAALTTIAEIEKLPGVAPGDLARAGLVFAAITQEQAAAVDPKTITPENRVTVDLELRAAIEKLQVIRAKTNSPEIASAVAALYLRRAAISAPSDREQLMTLAIQETLAGGGRRGAL